MVDSAIVASAALIAGWTGGSRRTRMAAATFGLVSSSAVLVHLSGGSIEMHFHFFVMIGVITMYHDWFPFLLAIAFVALHHGVMGVIAPAGVYNHPAAQANPWKWAGIHAFFVLAASVAYLVSWRMTEMERERAERYLIEIHDARLRQRQALEINDNVVQGLSIAKYALDAGDDVRAYEAVARTLSSARGIISDLLAGSDGRAHLAPGDLVREEAANPTVVA
jgi:mannitol-specific phosphotransferase system IIBC component